jgi:hypothetical protein
VRNSHAGQRDCGPLIAVVLFLASQDGLASAAEPPTAAAKVVAAGSRWQLDKTTRLASLTIGNGARLSAATGNSLTLTVNGVGTTIAPGSYRGNVVLTVTKRLSLGTSNGGPYDFRSAVLINDGKRVTERSVAAAVMGGTVSDAAASNVVIDSQEENFNGIIVMGDSNYTVDNAKIDLSGNGGNDFAGYGAAIMSAGNARLAVNHAQIKTRGAVRMALYVGGKSTMWVNDSTIEVASGMLPADYEFSIAPGKMKEVPYGLGISGNVRATNLMDEGTAYYNNSRFKSNGWGVLSSDGGGPTRMFVNNCIIETVGSGYGAYANGDAHDYFSNSTFNVADAGLIIGGNGWGTLTDGTVINSKKIGVFMHQGTGGSVLTVQKKSKIISQDTAVQIKGRGGDVIVDDSELRAGNGILIQSMENDDPIMKAMAAGGGGGGPPGGGGMPGSESGGYSPDVHATLRNSTLTGDIVHALTATADMTVTLQRATLTGAISTGVANPASGIPPSKATFRSVGLVVNTLVASPTAHTLKVSLDWASSWVVTKTSYLNGLALADGAALGAPAASQLRMIVNGVATPIKAGSYSGQIVLQVAPGS